MNQELAKLRDGPHLSASGLRDYIECGLHYRFSRIDKLLPEFTPSNLVVGSAVHSALEDLHRIWKEGETLSPDEGAALLELHVKKQVNQNRARGIPVRFKAGEDLESLMGQGAALVRLYMEDSAKQEEQQKILAVEQTFKIEMPGLPVPIIGAMDLLLEDQETGDITIVELKTAAKSYGAKDIDDTDQMTIYQLAMQELGYGDRDISLRIDTLVKTKTPKLERHVTARTEKDESRLIRKMQAAWKGISAGHFLPNDSSWKCSGCAYKKACNEWGMQQAA